MDCAIILWLIFIYQNYWFNLKYTIKINFNKKIIKNLSNMGCILSHLSEKNYAIESELISYKKNLSERKQANKIDFTKA